MLRPTVAQLQQGLAEGARVSVHGWVRTVRRLKRVAFVSLADGTSREPVQAVLSTTQAKT